MKIFQQAITDTIGTNEEIENLNKEIENLNKEEPNGTKAQQQNLKIQQMALIVDLSNLLIISQFLFMYFMAMQLNTSLRSVGGKKFSRWVQQQSGGNRKGPLNWELEQQKLSNTNNREKINRPSDLWVYNKRYNLHVTKIPEGNEKYYVAENVFEEIKAGKASSSHVGPVKPPLASWVLAAQVPLQKGLLQPRVQLG